MSLRRPTRPPRHEQRSSCRLADRRPHWCSRRPHWRR
jgi:hypothetical protein